MPEETLLASDDILGVKVILVSDCEQQKSNYYIVYKSDTLQFMYFASCKVMRPFENKEAVTISSRQVDYQSLPELILEYEHNNRGFHKELLVIQLEDLKILFRTEMEAYGQHVFGEELGDFYGFTNKIYFKENGEIHLEKPINKSRSPFGLRLLLALIVVVRCLLHFQVQFTRTNLNRSIKITRFKCFRYTFQKRFRGFC